MRLKQLVFYQYLHIIDIQCIQNAYFSETMFPFILLTLHQTKDLLAQVIRDRELDLKDLNKSVEIIQEDPLDHFYKTVEFKVSKNEFRS